MACVRCGQPLSVHAARSSVQAAGDSRTAFRALTRALNQLAPLRDVHGTSALPHQVASSLPPCERPRLHTSRVARAEDSTSRARRHAIIPPSGRTGSMNRAGFRRLQYPPDGVLERRLLGGRSRARAMRCIPQHELPEADIVPRPQLPARLPHGAHVREPARFVQSHGGLVRQRDAADE